MLFIYIYIYIYIYNKCNTHFNVYYLSVVSLFLSVVKLRECRGILKRLLNKVLDRECILGIAFWIPRTLLRHALYGAHAVHPSIRTVENHESPGNFVKSDAL